MDVRAADLPGVARVPSIYILRANVQISNGFVGKSAGQKPSYQSSHQSPGYLLMFFFNDGTIWLCIRQHIAIYIPSIFPSTSHHYYNGGSMLINACINMGWLLYYDCRIAQVCISLHVVEHT